MKEVERDEVKPTSPNQLPSRKDAAFSLSVVIEKRFRVEYELSSDTGL